MLAMGVWKMRYTSLYRTRRVDGKIDRLFRVVTLASLGMSEKYHIIVCLLQSPLLEWLDTSTALLSVPKGLPLQHLL